MDALYLEGCKQAKALNYFRHINYTIEQCSILFLFFFLLFSFHQCKIDKLLILFTIHKCKLNLKDGIRKSKFHLRKYNKNYKYWIADTIFLFSNKRGILYVDVYPYQTYSP